MQLLNPNEIIRSRLFRVYSQMERSCDKDESEVRYQAFLEELKCNNSSFYETIVGLFFLDCYRFCLYQNKKGHRNDTSKLILEIGNTINDMDDLLFEIEENSQFYFSILTFSHFYQKRISSVMKANMLKMLPDEYALKFSKFHSLEIESMFSPISGEELVSIYHQYYCEHAKTDPHIHNEAVNAVLEKLHILSIGNVPNYTQLLLTIIKECYIWKKGLSMLSPTIVFDLDKRFIDMVESQSLMDLSYDMYKEEDLLMALLEDYIFYQENCQGNSELSYEKIYQLYQKNVSQEVKAKLKEV